MVNPKIKIDNEATIALREAYNYIKKDSLQNAEKVKAKILKSIKGLIKNSDKYSPDKYRLDKNISYRVFEIYKYRITYHVSSDEIRIIRIKHTKNESIEILNRAFDKQKPTSLKVGFSYRSSI